MFDVLGKMLDGLFMINDDPRSTRNWRAIVSLFVLGFIVHIVWACGYLPGLQGFAMAAEQKDQRTTLVEIKVQLLDKNIIDTRKQQCQATNKQFFTERLQTMLREYQNLTRQPFALPDCRDF